uniref:zona pellucida-like domain-containing protein 1 n=1 Tax=Pristiophorus japonicus TaxID=55135 RepID=UPI00398F0844
MMMTGDVGLSKNTDVDMASLLRKLFFSISFLPFFIQDVKADYHCDAQYNRYPENQDIGIDCGPQLIDLSINICPALFAGFDSLTFAVNGQLDPKCNGTVDASLTPPVLRYSFLVSDSGSNNCGLNFRVVDEGPGTGALAQFSNLQSVVISGFINPPNNPSSVISYSPELYYRFSCKYPLEYILNNTRIITSSVSIAVATSNGSFGSSLTLQLYSDANYTSPLIVPDTGLPLRYKVYVEVSISNLTANFNVLLDHCFATPSPFNVSVLDTGYTFFTGCNVTPRTNIITNGFSQKSQFVFDAFRFTEHRDRKLSTIYVHCITRLCEAKTCPTLLKGCSSDERKRRRREIFPTERVTTETVTVSSGPIYTREEEYMTFGSPAPVGDTAQSGKEHRLPLEAPIIGTVLAGTVGLAVITIIGTWIRKRLYIREQPEQNAKDTSYSAR